jgi:hypothetical protein
MCAEGGRECINDEDCDVMSTKGDGDARYRRILGLLEQLKAHIEATDRKVAALEKAEERATARKVAALEKAEELAVEAVDVTKPNNEADVAETGRAGARNGRERSNNQPRPEKERQKRQQIPGPEPDVMGEWYDSKTRERGRWPKLVDTRQRVRALRGGRRRVQEYKIYEFPVGTERGQFQLWIDGNWAENVTGRNVLRFIAERGVAGARGQRWRAGECAPNDARGMSGAGRIFLQPRKGC